MTYSVRFGLPEDMEAVAFGDRSVSKKILEWKLQNQEIIMAVDDEEVVGYLRLESLWSKYPYIGLIMVRPDYRGNGMGRAMLAYLEDHLHKQGIRSLYSSSQVNEAEPQKWHRKMGFTECGILNGINEGGIGEIFFVKSL